MGGRAVDLAAFDGGYSICLNMLMMFVDLLLLTMKNITIMFLGVTWQKDQRFR